MIPTTGTERTHPTRRAAATAAVVLGVMAWVVLGVLSALGHAYRAAWIGSSLVVGGCWVTCRVLSRDLAERRVDDIDEYELEQRRTVRERGYVAALVAAVVLYVVLAVASELAQRGRDDLLLQAHHLLFVAFLPAAAGPSLLLAWRLRDDVDDPED